MWEVRHYCSYLIGKERRETLATSVGCPTLTHLYANTATNSSRMCSWTTVLNIPKAGTNTSTGSRQVDICNPGTQGEKTARGKKGMEARKKERKKLKRSAWCVESASRKWTTDPSTESGIHLGMQIGAVEIPYSREHCWGYSEFRLLFSDPS